MTDERLPRPKIPPELLAARPGLADVPTATHPDITPMIGDPPRKYSPAMHSRIVELIEEGNRPHVAAAIAGITATTFYAWMRDGKAGNVHLVQFVDDIETAMAVAEGSAIKTIRTPTSDPKLDTDNAKWWLTVARADGYSKEANTKANAMIAEFIDRIESILPAEVFQQVIAAATGQTLSAEKQVFRLQPADATDDSEE